MIRIARAASVALLVFAPPAIAEETQGVEAAAETGVVLSMESGRIALAHTLYWGGFHIGSLESRMGVGDADYEMEFHFRTEGMLSWFVDGRSRLSATGLRGQQGALIPRTFSTQSVWNDEARALDTRFDDIGRMQIVTREPDDTADREMVPNSLRDGYDPLSAVLTVALRPTTAGAADPENDGSRIIRTFDGKRAMRYSYNCGETDVLEASGDRVFAGEALRCEVTGRQLAGFHRKYRDRNLVLDRPATLWLAHVEDGEIMVPVRLMMQTQYGALMAHLSRIGPPTVDEDVVQN